MARVTELILERGMRAARDGRPSDAMRAYGEVMGRADSAGWEIGVARFNRGILRSRVKDFVGALEDWSAAVELEGASSWLLCRAWLERGNLRRSAFDEADDAGAICDYNAAMEHARRLETSQIAAAESRLFVGQAWSPRELIGHGLAGRGAARLGVGDEEGAMEDLATVIQMEAMSKIVRAEAYGNLAEALLILGKWDGAIEALRASLANVPNREVIRFLRALALLGKGDVGEAMAECQASLMAVKGTAVLGKMERLLARVEERRGELHGSAAIKRLLANEKERVVADDAKKEARTLRRMNLGR
jgi:tetratricopeptide (TPR) repeat protein